MGISNIFYNDVVGVGLSDFTYGLGFNWGGMTADFTVNIIIRSSRNYYWIW